MLDTKRIQELQSALKTKTDFIKEGIAKGVKVEGGNVEVKSEDWAALQKAKADVDQIKGLIALEMLPDEVKGLEQALATPNGPSTAVLAAALNASGAQTPSGLLVPQMKTLGQLFIESDEYKALKDSGALTMRTPFSLEAKDLVSMGNYGTKDVFTGAVPALTNRGFGSVQFDPMVPRAQRTYRVRDLFPASTTSSNLIDYFKVTGFVENGGDGNARTVRERAAADGTSAPTGAATDTFGLKPKSNLQFTSAQAPVRTIAHWEAAHRNVLQDEPQLQSTINNELLYGLALEEDDQILNGDGTGENLTGILRTDGIQDYLQATHADDLKSDALRRSATLCVLANLPGTGFVLHPFDWEEIELQKANYTTSGDGQYMLVTNFAVGADTRIWRQPVVETPAMPEGTWLTGAFGLGAQLYDRMQASVRVAEQHADFFVRNAVAILAEERLALAVKRPEAFVKGTFKAA